MFRQVTALPSANGARPIDDLQALLDALVEEDNDYRPHRSWDHAGTRVIVVSQDLDIRIIDAATGELLRELSLDTSKRDQGTGRPPGPTRQR